MICRRTVFILGAGASASYGFPVGARLRTDILAIGEESLKWELREYQPGTPGEFLRAFRGSNAPSIDSFLEHRREFLPMGRAAIAKVLLDYERACESKSFEALHGDDWYGYLAEAMMAPWEHLKANNVAFVSFNYDRSLERYLTKTWADRFGKTADEAAALVAHFPFVHVYGRLGSLGSKDKNYVPFGGRKDELGYRHRAAQNLQVVPEGRDDDAVLEHARQLLSSADALVILGFGFDATNVRRLGGHSIGANGRMDENAGFRYTDFAATGYGLTDAERKRAASMISDQRATAVAAKRILDLPCRALLRETLVLYPF